MNIRIGRRIIAALLVVVAIAALGQSAHAQPNISTQSDRASYVPGDSGTLTVTLINPDTSNTVEVRNLTVYFPWASTSTVLGLRGQTSARTWRRRGQYWEAYKAATISR